VILYNPDKDPQQHSKILRLMANCALNSDNMTQALQCVQMANELHECASGLYLVTKIYLKLRSGFPIFSGC